MLSCSLLLALFFGSPEADGDALHHAVTAIFRGDAAQDAGADEVAASLADLGPDGLEPVFDAIARGFVADEGHRLRVTVTERKALVNALGEFQRPALHALLLSRLESEDSESSATALRLLGTFGEGRHFKRIVACVEASEGSDANDEILDAFEDCFVELARRDPSTISRIRWAWGKATREVQGVWLLALGESGQQEASDLLLSLLEWGDGEPSALIAHVDRISAVLNRDSAAAASATIRPYLEAEDLGTVKAATLSLGRLGDIESIEVLIELLVHEQAGVRANAHWSLKRITGRNFSVAGGPWRVWFREQSQWFEREAERIVGRLESADAAVVTAALQDVTRHPLHRDAFVWDIVAVLAHESVAARVMACHVLRELSQGDTLPFLIDSLTDESDRVVAAAHDALRRMTRLDLPPSPEEWEEVVGERQAP